VADVSRTIIVAGNYRCGTTWLAEMLAKGIDGYELVFEPIRAYLPTMANSGITQWRPYITASSATRSHVDAFSRVLSGDVCRTDELSRTDANKVLLANGLVVKFVRGLMSLRWMVDRFSPRAAFVIRRHPCSAIASQLRVDAPKGTPVGMHCFQEFLGRHQNISIREPRTDAQWLALWYAASYYAALSTPMPHPWHVVKYEDLCAGPESVMKRIFIPLGESPKDVGALFSKLSMTSREWSTGKPTGWKKFMGHHAADVWEVCSWFPGVTDGYAAP